ncbi:LysR substrate-binding domain-containing protein [Steroidobacter sp.]|uniref:LysR substrate-binding domain-containing protein n=1 Tax=Steroidobacter sp. TaxID=1978227 RepID=UPI001A445B0C|nr:LysR substrate-binding domain-containing protein [Steroidobacter sp.]MBL8266893.1 LysR family transcriptional regulator [Steroidobacter sp.]
MKVNLDIDLLRTLVAFADAGSFKGAAQLVLRSQPAVSMQMRRLEELVGHPLFTKRGRDMVFTDKGEQLAQQARQILALHDKVVSTWRGGDAGGRVVLGLPDDYAALLLPDIFAELTRSWPNVSVEVVVNTSPVLIEQLDNGQLDLAILATQAPKRSDVILRKEPVVWTGSPDHDTHLQRPIKLAVFSDESPVYRATIAALRDSAREGEVAPDFRIGVKSKSWTVLVAAARAGFAVTTMARCVVPPGLRILGPEDGFPNLGDIHIVMRGTPDTQSIATSKLAERILEAFRRNSPTG